MRKFEKPVQPTTEDPVEKRHWCYEYILWAWRTVTTPNEITLTDETASSSQASTITIDNSKGESGLGDFQINALEYMLDMNSFARGRAVIALRNAIGGDVDFKHFDVGAGKVERISQSNPRYWFVLRLHRLPDGDPDVAFDSQIHYLCLRFVFTKQDTGEKFVHYIVISPYVNGFDLAQHPERAAGSEKPGSGNEGFPFSIARTIKQDARAFYGTEYHEYQP
jgi:hypothetical protein